LACWRYFRPSSAPPKHAHLHRAKGRTSRTPYLPEPGRRTHHGGTSEPTLARTDIRG
jgi:hypothetical protein